MYDQLLKRTAIVLDIPPEMTDRPILPQPTALQPPARRRISYAITMTKDGPFQDGAAVLA